MPRINPSSLMSTTGRQLARPAVHQTIVMMRRISSFNKTPPKPNQGPFKKKQAMPLGAYYEMILIEPQPIEDVKPEEPPQSAADQVTSPSGENMAEEDEKGESYKGGHDELL